MKVIFIMIILTHGLIHFLGFSKAFEYGNIAQLTREISRPMGLLWSVTGLLFIVTTILILLKIEEWWFLGLIAVIISQLLILTSWHDAMFGTIANVIIAVAAILSWGTISFEKRFQNDVKENLRRTNSISVELLTDSDLQAIPEPVQRYLRYAGVVNKPKVKNIRIVFEGEMRDKGKEYFPFTSEQYNFFDEPTRLFFMKGKMFGLTIPGYHKYSNAKATMDIRLFGLFPVVKQAGDIMNKTETVTLFNDMCMLAPATLIDKRIKWQKIDSTMTMATFTNRGISINAVLYFNSMGQLIDFKSEDRTSIADMKQYPFSTPVSEYKNRNGINTLSRAEAVWHYPDGKFTYGKFTLKAIENNVSE